jgi:NADH dehydrogenase/NADH:ubiquinone oxidoreductase subunit G
MADEKKTETTETPTAKKGIIGSILTSIVCLIIGAGAMFGIDYARVQDALDDAYTKQLISDVTAATVAETIENEGIVSVVISDDKKAEITTAAVEKNTTDDAIAKFIADAKAAVAAAKEAAKSAKPAVEEVKEKVEEIKDKLEGAKDAATEATAPVADAN